MHNRNHRSIIPVKEVKVKNSYLTIRILFCFLRLENQILGMDTDDSKEIREELNLYAGIEKTLFSMGLCSNDTNEESEDSDDSVNSETGFRGFLEDPIPSTSGNSKATTVVQIQTFDFDINGCQINIKDEFHSLENDENQAKVSENFDCKNVEEKSKKDKCLVDDPEAMSDVEILEIDTVSNTVIENIDISESAEASLMTGSDIKETLKINRNAEIECKSNFDAVKKKIIESKKSVNSSVNELKSRLDQTYQDSYEATKTSEALVTTRSDIDLDTTAMDGQTILLDFEEISDFYLTENIINESESVCSEDAEK